MCQKTGIIFRVKEFRTTSSILQCFNCQGSDTRHQTVPKTKNVFCVVKLIHTKAVQIKKRGIRNEQIVGELMLPIREAVLHIRTKLLGSTWSRNKLLMPPF